MSKRYSTPEEGTLDWHVPLNDNFERLERDVEIRDRDEAKGSYTPRAGAKFFAIDSGNIYIGDGSEWSPIDTINRPGTIRSGYVVPLAPGLSEVTDAIDPSKTETPIQDAAAAINSATGRFQGGTIYLPPLTVQERAGEIPPDTFRNINIIGCGIDSSKIEFTDTREGGIHFETKDDRNMECYWTDFTLHGSDAESGNRAGSAMRFTESRDGTGGCWGFNIGRLGFEEWSGPIVHFDEAGVWSSRWEYLNFRMGGRNCGTNLKFDWLGPAFTINHVDLASDTKAVGIDGWNEGTGIGGQLNIGTINTFQKITRVMDWMGVQNASCEIGIVSFEPTVNDTTSVMRISQRGWFRVGTVFCLGNGVSLDVDEIVDLTYENGRNVIGYLHHRGDGSIRNNKINVSDASFSFDAPSYYFGPESDIQRSASPAYIKALGQNLLVASGSVTLTGGSATVDTGIPSSETATFNLALGPTTANADIGAEIRARAEGNYEIDFVEGPDTNVGEPTVEYDVFRVR